MQAELQRLIELQQVDLRLLELQKQLDTFPKRRAALDRELAAAQAALEKARTQLTEFLKLRKKLELDAQQFDERIRKHKDQLYEVKSNDAYRALQHEIEQDEQLKRAAEDKELEAMVRVDDLEKEIKAAEAALKQTSARIDAARQALDAEEQARRQEAAAASAERDQLRGGVEPDTLSVYDRIARIHGGIALSEAADEVCQVCRIHLRPQIYNEVKRGDQLLTCDSCHRILYYVAATAPAPEPSAPVPASGSSAA